MFAIVPSSACGTCRKNIRGNKLRIQYLPGTPLALHRPEPSSPRTNPRARAHAAPTPGR